MFGLFCERIRCIFVVLLRVWPLRGVRAMFLRDVYSHILSSGPDRLMHFRYSFAVPFFVVLAPLGAQPSVSPPLGAPLGGRVFPWCGHWFRSGTCRAVAPACPCAGPSAFWAICKASEPGVVVVIRLALLGEHPSVSLPLGALLGERP